MRAQKGSAFPGEFNFPEKVTFELHLETLNRNKQGDDMPGDKSFWVVGPPVKRHGDTE